MQSYMLETVQYISVVGQTCQMGCLSFRMRSRGQIVFSSNDFQVSSMFLSDLNVLLLSTAVLLLSTAVLLLSTICNISQVSVALKTGLCLTIVPTKSDSDVILCLQLLS